MNKIVCDKTDNESEGNTSNSEINNNINGKRTRNRLTKKQQYKNERKEIINKINNLLDIYETKNYVYLYDIENNEKTKAEINKMSEEVKKYFKVGNWNYYIMKNNGEKPLEIGLIRALYRDEGWLMTTKEKQIERNGKKLRSVIYYLVKE